MDHLGYCDLLAVEVERFASVIDCQPTGVAVPGCPGWCLGDLTKHLGTVHRWAEHLVRVRAQGRISHQDMGLGAPEESADWLRAGGEALLATLRSADPGAPMWAWGADQHVRFWSRRQLHETLVHRMDAELALGRVPEASPAVAADATDEFLANLPSAARFSPKVAELRGNGTRLVFRATDTERGWWVTLQPGGFEVSPAPTGPPDATLAGPAVTLLLVLYRRLPVTEDGIVVTGERAAVERWLANSALE
jgi:uncharacterized protein (TIGR03083 family)